MFIRNLNRLLRRLGLELHCYPGNLSMERAIARAAKRNLAISTVIDVGASDGQWSRITQRYFATASYFLMEANPVHQQKLESFKKQLAKIDYVIAAAGDEVGKAYFDASDDFGGLASHTPTGGKMIEVPLTTIDVQVREKKLAPPFMIKLDTHGFEVPIFNGAAQTLTQTNLIVVEAYNFKLTNSSLRFHEMCAFLEKKGFRCVDLCDPLFRPQDDALWQFDLFFIRDRRPEFSHNTYEISAH